mgnify:CR=1 FL=1
MHWLRSIFYLPPIDAEDSYTTIQRGFVYQSSQLTTIIAFLLIISGTILGVSGGLLDYVLLVVLLLLGIGCTLLAGYGRHRIAGVILAVSAWAIIARDIVYTGVVTAPSFAALIIPILLAGLAVGLKLGLVLAVLSALLGVYVLIGQTGGWLEPHPYTPIQALVMQAIILVSAVLTPLIVVHRLGTLLNRINQQDADLRVLNEKLSTLGGLRDEFVANISHELRTPLTNIRLYLALLPQRPEKSEQYIATLHRETVRLHAIIENLLSISDIKRGLVDPKYLQVDLNTMISILAADRRTLADQREITLLLRLEQGLAPVVTDPTMINRVLEILVSNALLYIQDRGTITIHTEAAERTNQPGVAIMVSDNGPGIAPEDQAHLFDRFYRGKAGRSGRPGVGVGLAIARELLRSSGGTLSVQSAGIAGKGAQITAWIPFKPGNAVSDSPD